MTSLKSSPWSELRANATTTANQPKYIPSLLSVPAYMQNLHLHRGVIHGYVELSSPRTYPNHTPFRHQPATSIETGYHANNGTVSSTNTDQPSTMDTGTTTRQRYPLHRTTNRRSCCQWSTSCADYTTTTHAHCCICLLCCCCCIHFLSSPRPPLSPSSEI